MSTMFSKIYLYLYGFNLVDKLYQARTIFIHNYTQGWLDEKQQQKGMRRVLRLLAMVDLCFKNLPNVVEYRYQIGLSPLANYHKTNRVEQAANYHKKVVEILSFFLCVLEVRGYPLFIVIRGGPMDPSAPSTIHWIKLPSN